jgi:asparagine synthase (glutamine-hydrolysing)
MPLSNEDGTIWVVHNGEIYNHRELRGELEARGHRFSTHSDTEVIVHLYEEFGERCVERLEGMFAFGLWDGPRRRLVLARDRLGQKPLFYESRPERLLFASEPKAILAARDQAPELDATALHHFLSLRFVPPPRTMFAGIHKLPPAHTLVFEGGATRIQRYWSLSFSAKLDVSDAEFATLLDERMDASVRSHLVSDVPVGALLSGGLDSSSIVALVAPSATPDLQTFAIGVDAPDFDESPYAEAVARHCGTRHRSETVGAEVVELLPRMIHHLDEPCDPIAACQFKAAEFVSRHVKVVLGGDGGDELFAGFDRYLGMRWVHRYAGLPASLRERVLHPLIRSMPDTFAYKSIAQRARWLAEVSMAATPGERYAAATCFFRFTHAEKMDLYGADLADRTSATRSIRIVADRYDEGEGWTPLDRMLYADYTTRLPEHSLALVDRMSMAHGVEVRSPFLDHELVSLLAAFPDRLKIHRGRLKVALREWARTRLPTPVVERAKQGFMFPVAYWLRSRLFEVVKQRLLTSHLVRSGLFRESYVRRILQEHHTGKVDHHVRIWMLLSVVIWHQLYIERRDLEELSAGLRIDG